MDQERPDASGSSQSQTQDLITIRLGARTMLAVIALVATAYLFVYIPHFFIQRKFVDSLTMTGLKG